VERILARAGALQEIHGQLLSLEQIEAIAAEIGIKPEFVHLAMEQEKQGSQVALEARQEVVPATETVPANIARLRIVSTMIASTLVAATYTMVANAKGNPSGLFLLLTLCVFPLCLSLALGWLSRSRRWGSASGLALAVTAIAACQIISYYQGYGVTWDATDLQIFSIAIASSTLLGAAGAQARRLLKLKRRAA
jgi:hypothetical protein